MTATERDHLREERQERIFARIDATLSEATIWRARYDLWVAESRQ